MIMRLIQGMPGFAPQIGRLVAMMNHARVSTLEAVSGLSIKQLDYLHDQESNSIGALLAHIAGVEFVYHVYSFEGRGLHKQEQKQWNPAIVLGESGRREIRNRPLEHYTTLMGRLRERTISRLAPQTDDWLDEERRSEDRIVNNYYIWFHVFENELKHCGQIQWLRKRVPGT